MSEADINRIEILLTRLIGALEERCPQQQKSIDQHEKDINAAFSRIRNLETKVTRLTVIFSLITPVLTAGLVQFFVR